MARFVVSAVVGITAGIFLGPQAGFAAFSLAYGLTAGLDPNQKVSGPRLDDLKAPSSSYGSVIPYIEGYPRLGGVWAWCSEKRELATTQSTGKGGPGIDSTTYTYEMDILVVFNEGTFAGIRRAWSNGKLVYTVADVSDAASIAASQSTNAWRELRIMSGAADQLPDPTYEAAFGAGNVPAMRDRGCVMLVGVNLGSSGQPPNLTFEVVRSGSIGQSPVRLHVTYEDGTANDISDSPIIPTINYPEYLSIAGGVATFSRATDGTNNTPQAIYSDPKLYQDGSIFTVYVKFAARPSYVVDSGSTDAIRVFSYYNGSLEIAMGFRVETGILKVVAYHADDTGATAEILDITDESLEYKFVFNETASGQVRYYIGSTLIYELNGFPSGISGQFIIGENKLSARLFQFSVDEIKLFVAADTVPAVDEELDQVVLRQCFRAGLLESQVDVTSLAGQYVHAMAVSQISTPRQIVENLMAAYRFDAVESDVLRFVVRGAASVATIPFEDLGATSDGSTIDQLPLTKSNDLEIPQQVTVKFANIDNDQQDGSENSDRLLTGGKGVQVTELPLGLTPTEAKRIADVTVTDYAASMVRVGPLALNRKYAALEPTDPVDVIDEDGTVYRVRLQQRKDAAGLLTFQGIVDNISVLTSRVQTTAGYHSSTEVVATGDTIAYLLDMPILRDSDNAPGFYVAAKGTTSKWFGYSLLKSLDDVNYTSVYDATGTAVMGRCTTILGPFDGGFVFDMINTVTVNVASGTLSGFSRNAILTGTAPGYLVGDEVIFALSAAMVSAGVYTLSGLLRGRRGTEWAIAEHVASERFVVLQTTGLRRVEDQLADLGINRFWKAVSTGKSFADATAQQFSEIGIGLKPFAPCDLRVSTSLADDIGLTWKRRTRLATRLVGSAGSNVPLGEASEAYEVDVVNTGTSAVIRTLTSGTAAITYTSAMQAADSVTGTTALRFDVYQISASVGRGYPASVETVGARSPRPQIAQVTIGGTFAAGAPLTVTIGSTVYSYTTVTGDSTLAGIAASFAPIIDAAVGYTATASGPVITITGANSVAWTVDARQNAGNNAVTFALTQTAALAAAAVRRTISLNFLSPSTWNSPEGDVFALYITAPGVSLYYSVGSVNPTDYMRVAALQGLQSQVAASGDAFAYGFQLIYSASESELQFSSPLVDPTNWLASAAYYKSAGSNGNVQAVGAIVNNGQIGIPADRPQIITATFSGTPVTGYKYRITLAGVNFDYVATGADTTMSAIASQLAPIIDASSSYLASASGAVITITHASNNVPFQYLADIIVSTVTISAAVTQTAK